VIIVFLRHGVTMFVRRESSCSFIARHHVPSSPVTMFVPHGRRKSAPTHAKASGDFLSIVEILYTQICGG